MPEKTMQMSMRGIVYTFSFKSSTSSQSCCDPLVFVVCPSPLSVALWNSFHLVMVGLLVLCLGALDVGHHRFYLNLSLKRSFKESGS